MAQKQELVALRDVLKNQLKKKLEDKVLEIIDMTNGDTDRDILEYIRVAGENGFDAEQFLLKEIVYEIGKKQIQANITQRIIEEVERRFEDYLARDDHLQKVEQGLRFKSRQELLQSGRLDILAEDPEAKEVLVELKAKKLSNRKKAELFFQLEKYLNEKDQARAILIAPEIDPAIFYGFKRHVDSGRLRLYEVQGDLEHPEAGNYSFTRITQENLREGNHKLVFKHKKREKDPSRIRVVKQVKKSDVIAIPARTLRPAEEAKEEAKPQAYEEAKSEVQPQQAVQQEQTVKPVQTMLPVDGQTVPQIQDFIERKATPMPEMPERQVFPTFPAYRYRRAASEKDTGKMIGELASIFTKGNAVEAVVAIDGEEKRHLCRNPDELANFLKTIDSGTGDTLTFNEIIGRDIRPVQETQREEAKPLDQRQVNLDFRVLNSYGDPLLAHYVHEKFKADSKNVMESDVFSSVIEEFTRPDKRNSDEERKKRSGARTQQKYLDQIVEDFKSGAADDLVGTEKGTMSRLFSTTAELVTLIPSEIIDFRIFTYRQSNMPERKKEREVIRRAEKIKSKFGIDIREIDAHRTFWQAAVTFGLIKKGAELSELKKNVQRACLEYGYEIIGPEEIKEVLDRYELGNVASKILMNFLTNDKAYREARRQIEASGIKPLDYFFDYDAPKISEPAQIPEEAEKGRIESKLVKTTTAGDIISSAFEGGMQFAAQMEPLLKEIYGEHGERGSGSPEMFAYTLSVMTDPSIKDKKRCLEGLTAERGQIQELESLRNPLRLDAAIRAYDEHKEEYEDWFSMDIESLSRSIRPPFENVQESDDYNRGLKAGKKYADLVNSIQEKAESYSQEQGGLGREKDYGRMLKRLKELQMRMQTAIVEGKNDKRIVKMRKVLRAFLERTADPVAKMFFKGLLATDSFYTDEINSEAMRIRIERTEALRKVDPDIANAYLSLDPSIRASIENLESLTKSGGAARLGDIDSFVSKPATTMANRSLAVIEKDNKIYSYILGLIKPREDKKSDGIIDADFEMAEDGTEYVIDKKTSRRIGTCIPAGNESLLEERAEKPLTEAELANLDYPYRYFVRRIPSPAKQRLCFEGLKIDPSKSKKLRRLASNEAVDALLSEEKAECSFESEKEDMNDAAKHAKFYFSDSAKDPEAHREGHKAAREYLRRLRDLEQSLVQLRAGPQWKGPEVTLNQLYADCVIIQGEMQETLKIARYEDKRVTKFREITQKLIKNSPDEDSRHYFERAMYATRFRRQEIINAYLNRKIERTEALLEVEPEVALHYFAFDVLDCIHLEKEVNGKCDLKEFVYDMSKLEHYIKTDNQLYAQLIQRCILNPPEEPAQRTAQPAQASPPAEVPKIAERTFRGLVVNSNLDGIFSSDMIKRVDYFEEDMKVYSVAEAVVKQTYAALEQFHLAKRMRKREDRPDDAGFRTFFDDIMIQYVHSGRAPTTADLERLYSSSMPKAQEKQNGGQR